MDDYNRMVRYWSKNPPVHLMLAAFFGIAGESKGGSVTRSPADNPEVPSYKNESYESLIMRWGGTPGAGMRH